MSLSRRFRKLSFAVRCCSRFLHIIYAGVFVCLSVREVTEAKWAYPGHACWFTCFALCSMHTLSNGNCNNSSTSNLVANGGEEKSIMCEGELEQISNMLKHMFSNLLLPAYTLLQLFYYLYIDSLHIV